MDFKFWMINLNYKDSAKDLIKISPKAPFNLIYNILV
jgi:hypothetical protein